jgi:hypothetical protein
METAMPNSITYQDVVPNCGHELYSKKKTTAANPFMNAMKVTANTYQITLVSLKEILFIKNFTPSPPFVIAVRETATSPGDIAPIKISRRERSERCALLDMRPAVMKNNHATRKAIKETV